MTATPTPDDGAALKPCPFCGSEGVLHESSRGFLVVCQSTGGAQCDIGNTHNDWTKEAAIEMWNRRTRSPAPVSGEAEARVKELEGVLRYIIEYGERSGLKRVQQVCDMTLKGMDMSPLRQEPTQHCAGAGREGGV